MMDKQIQRKNARQRRSLLSPQVRQEYSVMAAENAMMLLEGSKADVVAIYASTPEETSTWPLMDQLLMRGYYPVFPLVQGEKMVPIMWDENTVFVSNKMGILEPVGGTEVPLEEIQFVIVPGLAFDEDGNRLGQGGGHYDRFLPQTHALRVGYCFQTQMVHRLEPEPHDVKMDYICTEIYTYDCAKKQTK